MSAHQSDDARFDCIVGGGMNEVPPVDDMASQLHVTISGEGASEFGALAAAQDLKYLIQAFHGDAPALGHDVAHHISGLRSRDERTVEILLHDLGLDPASEADLRNLIQKVVEASMDAEFRS